LVLTGVLGIKGCLYLADDIMLYPRNMRLQEIITFIATAYPMFREDYMFYRLVLPTAPPIRSKNFRLFTVIGP